MPASKQYYYTRHFYESIARLDQIILLTFLNPFLKDQNFFNKNKSQIQSRLQTFLMQEHSEELKQKARDYYIYLNTPVTSGPYTLEQILTALSRTSCTQENTAILYWAKINLKHYYFLEQVVKQGTLYQAYASLLGFKNTIPVAALQAVLCTPLLPEQAHKAKTYAYDTNGAPVKAPAPATKIAALVPTLVQDFGLHAARYHRDLDTVSGYPINQSFPEQYGMLILAIAWLIVIAALTTFAFTAMPVIPTLTLNQLNHLYVNVFSALAWVGKNHHFSFKAIYIMSVSFVTLIDALLLVSAVGIASQHMAYEKEVLAPAFQQKMLPYCMKELAVLNAGMQLAPVSETEFSCYNVKNRTVEQQKFYNSILTYKGAAASPINRVGVL